ncbi:uncharacterized protein LOC112171221 [Rosa chinensis]|uniref:uncharacterized protein LOC112171221 n=1 Tax=Rosa chinensis TaxID=74649 RepID=UPI000D097C9A|nr:uncharacterized protein LOC112171221 [Rosa chinensis]
MTAICPWTFLADDAPQMPAAPSPPKAKSFASILRNSMETSITYSQLPPPMVRGGKTYVKISEDLYQDQLKSFKTNLIGRLLLRKGSPPCKATDLKVVLHKLWQPISPWRLVPLGKGFFDIHFETEEDMRRVWGGGTCTLTKGIFRLSQWKQDFKPGDTCPQTHAQVWVRILGLSQDYWHPRHLLEIARGIGTPLQLDRATKERAFGYFARLLVDVDLTGSLPSTLMVEREGYEFEVSLEYERLPPICSCCGLVGHDVNHCRQRKSTEDPKKNVKTTEASKQVAGKQEYRLVKSIVVKAPIAIALIPTELIVNSPIAEDIIENAQLGNNRDSSAVEQFVNQVIAEAANEEIDHIAQVVAAEPLVENISQGENVAINSTDLPRSPTHVSNTIPSPSKSWFDKVEEEQNASTGVSPEFPPGFTPANACHLEGSSSSSIALPQHVQKDIAVVNSWLLGKDFIEDHALSYLGPNKILTRSQRKRLRKKIRDTISQNGNPSSGGALALSSN